MAITNKNRVPALAYYRTSSAANVGADKDSEKRQRAAVEGFANRAGYRVEGEFYDEAVSGKDPIEGRPGFKALLERIVGNGVRTVIVEDASRFARHLMTQEAGIALLVSFGVRVLTANGDDLTDSDDEFRVAMRQIMGVFSQLERTRLVKKLKAARDRKRGSGVDRRKVEGRKSHSETRPEVVAEAKRLRRANPKTGERLSYQRISKALAEAGFVNENGRPYNPKSVRAMTGQQ
ncbi:MAG: recombinase family protein [Proteobacteria bacterium]|nr:recombinase family protein [Pseudomonadota bacterium]